MSVDIDGDGDEDVIGISREDRYLFVLRHDMRGAYVNPEIYPVTGRPIKLALGDLDESGDPDVVVIDEAKKSLLFYFNDGDGNFGTPFAITSVLKTPGAIHVIDMNSDNRLDIVLEYQSDDNIYILWNQGLGQFDEVELLLALDRSTGYKLADIDDDGDADMVDFRYRIQDIGIRLNDGDGTFSERTTFRLSRNIDSLEFFDVNDDYLPDIVARSSMSLHVFLNQGASTFGDASTYPIDDVVTMLRAADVTGDGLPDLCAIIGNTNAINAAVLRSAGAGAFHPAQTLPFDACRDMQLMDVDADGDIDIAAAVGGFSSIKNIGSGEFRTRFEAPTVKNSRTVAITDFNQDGHQDIVVTSDGFEPGIVSIRLGDSTGNAQEIVQTTVGNYPNTVLCPDVNGDGLNDVVVLSGSSRVLSVFLNQAGIGLSPRVDYPVATGSAFFATGDIDNDSDVDLVVRSSSAGTLTILRNSGLGIFAADPPITVGDDGLGVALADIDGDSDLDIAVCGRGNGWNFLVLRNDGTGTYSISQQLVVGSIPTSVVFGDLDLDGDQDLVVASSQSSTLHVLTNAGTGFYSPASSYETHNYAQQLAIEDFDRDGRLDIVLHTQTRQLDLFWNAGGATFLPKRAFHTTFTAGIATGDLNHDGFADIVYTASLANTVAVILNEAGKRFGPRCPADVDGDAFVTANDFVVLANNFGAEVPVGTLGDLNGDGVVNAADFVIFAADFGCSP